MYEDLNQGVYISDIATGEDLGCIAPKVKMHGAICDQTPEDKKRINQLTGRTKGVTVKARKAAQAKINEGLSLNPEAIAYINTHALPKDVRQIAIQDAEVRRAMADQGANFNGMPIRENKAAAIEVTNVKTKNVPFMPVGNTITIGLDEDISCN